MFHNIYKNNFLFMQFYSMQILKGHLIKNNSACKDYS